MSEYMDRLRNVAHLLDDPAAITEWHPEGQAWLQEHLLSALTIGEPIALLTSSLLMGLRSQDAATVARSGVSTIAVGDRELLVNGVAMAHPEGLIRGEPELARSVLLHEAMHIILLHSVRMTECFRNLREQGLLDAPGRTTTPTAMRIANLVLDVVVDSTAAAAIAELKSHNHTMLTEHGASMQATLGEVIDQHCDGSIDSAWLNRGVADQSLSTDDAMRRIIGALVVPPPPPMAGGGDGDGDGDGGQGGSLSDDLADVEVHVRPLEDDSPAACQNARTMTAAAVAAAGKQAGSQTALGRLCIDATEWLKPPKVSWQDQLTAIVSSLSDDLSYEYAYQPELYRGVVLPDYKPGVGTLALAFDTSGSVMFDPVLRSQLLTEMADILATLPFERILFMPTDAEVKACIELAPGDPIPAEKFLGGGGTSFDGPFRYIEQHSHAIDVMLYFTDLYGSVHVDEPEYPTIWLIGDNSSDHTPPFGSVVQIPSDEIGQ